MRFSGRVCGWGLRTVEAMDSLLSILDVWQPKTVLVLGDFMLDQHVYGDAERLSADAPVPVLRVRRTDARPGGAANVCLDLIALRCKVLAFGVVGDDEAGRTLRASLQASGVDASGLVVDSERPTTQKQNIVGLAQSRHPQKMFRVDFESSDPISGGVEDRMFAAIEQAMAACDVVCIEDYAKGVCSPSLCQRVIRAARAAKKPVMVDPARMSDYSRYAGATTITPNRTEAETATGLAASKEETAEMAAKHNAELARSLMDSLALETCVLTLDRHGALLLEKGGAVTAVPTVARQVYDVTGAGDMFLAALAAAYANGAGWLDSVRFANAAAGLEVEVFGVQPIPLEQVHHSVLVQTKKLSGKLRTLDQLMIEVNAAKRQGKKVAFTNGCFDVLHSGHVTLLDKAAETADLLIVGLNCDESIRRLKGPSRPINREDDRATVLGALASVACVVLFGEEGDDTPRKLIEAIRPDVLIKGGDYTEATVVGADVVRANGGRVVLIPLVEGRSTTATVARMAGSR